MANVFRRQSLSSPVVRVLWSATIALSLIFACHTCARVHLAHCLSVDVLPRRQAATPSIVLLTSRPPRRDIAPSSVSSLCYLIILPCTSNSDQATLAKHTGHGGLPSGNLGTFSTPPTISLYTASTALLSFKTKLSISSSPRSIQPRLSSVDMLQREARQDIMVPIRRLACIR